MEMKKLEKNERVVDAQRRGRTAAVALGGAAAAIAGYLLLDQLDCLGRRETLPPPAPPECVEDCSEEVAGALSKAKRGMLPDSRNRKCEPGEWHVFSTPAKSYSFDPECGFCGNGQQDVFETAENCRIDFYCNDEVAQTGKNVVMEAGFVKQADGSYRMDVIEVDECDENSPFHCKTDCDLVALAKNSSSSGSRRHSGTPPEKRIHKGNNGTRFGPCTKIAGFSSHTDTRNFFRSVRGSIELARSPIAKAIGASGSFSVRLNFTISNGGYRLTGGSAKVSVEDDDGTVRQMTKPGSAFLHHIKINAPAPYATGGCTTSVSWSHRSR